MNIFNLIVNNLPFIFGIFGLSIITTISGVGGGGIFIPYMIFNDFTLEDSVPLTITIILGDSVIKMLLLYNLPNPDEPKRYLMDLTPSNIIVPFDAIFSWLGVILIKIIPSFFTIILVILLSIISIIKIGKNGLKECKKRPDIIIYPEIDGIEIYLNNHMKDKPEDDRKRNLYLIILNILIVGLFGLRDKFIKCSLEYWLLIGGNVFSMILMSLINSKFINYQYEKRKENNFNFIPSDIKWNYKNIIILGSLSSIAGILSTWLGLGGSSLITPILYYFEMSPDVVSVSIGVSTLFSSLISLLNYIFGGNYLLEWGIILYIVSSLGSICGVLLLKVIMKKLNKGFISLLVVLMLVISSISLLINILNNSDNFKSNNFC